MAIFSRNLIDQRLHKEHQLRFPWGQNLSLSPPYLISSLTVRQRNYLRYVFSRSPSQRARMILSLVGWRSRYQRKSLYSYLSRRALSQRRQSERSLLMIETLAKQLKRSQYPYIPPPGLLSLAVLEDQ